MNIFMLSFCPFWSLKAPGHCMCSLKGKNIIKSKCLLWSMKERRSVTLVWKDVSEWIINVEQLVYFIFLTVMYCNFLMPIAEGEKMSNGGLPWILKDATGLYTSAVQYRIPKYGDEALYLVLSPREWRADFGREREREWEEKQHIDRAQQNLQRKQAWLHLTFLFFFFVVFWKAFSCQSF